MLSSLVPENEKSSSNQNDVPLSDNLTTSSNNSEIVPNQQLDKRQYALSMQAGRLIGVSSNPKEWRDDAKRCTVSFPVKRVGKEPIDRGYLLIGNCLSTDTINQRNGIFYFRPTLDPDDPEIIKVGEAHTNDLVYRRFLGLDFTIVRLIPNPARVTVFSRSVKVRGEDGNIRTVDLVNQPYFAVEGTRVCVTTGHTYGQAPQIICGTVTSLNAPHTALNP